MCPPLFPVVTPSYPRGVDHDFNILKFSGNWFLRKKLFKDLLLYISIKNSSPPLVALPYPQGS